MALVNELNQVYPSTCTFVLAVREQYSEWRYTMDYGYIRYHTGSVIRYEHKLVAELVHGPKPDGWHCHHIDGNRINNDALNLTYLTSSLHTRVHRSSRFLMWCDMCRNEIWIDRTRINRNHHHFCSAKCANKHKRMYIQSQGKSRKPTRDHLQQLLIDVPNFCELGRMFNVSDNAVRKWARNYDLNFSHIDGRRK